MRRLGVYGQNNPTKKGAAVTAANFLQAGLVAKFERKFDKAFMVRSPQELQAIFGKQVDATMFGWDAANGFFANASGVAAALWVSSHVGYTGSAIDAVQAFSNLQDTEGSPLTIVKIGAGYQGYAEYGISGNRTGYTVETGDRFSTSCATAATSVSTKIFCASVAGMRVGDIVKMVCTGGTPATIYKQITALNTSENSFSLAAAIGVTYPLVNDVITIPGFRIHTWRQDISGSVSEVDTPLGQTWLSPVAAVSDFFPPNVFQASNWLQITAVGYVLPATLSQAFPNANATITYLTTGADGTAPTTAAHWDRAMRNFDGLPVRFATNPETTVAAIHKAAETYFKSRTDTPIWLPVLAEGLTKAQLIAAGNGFQRSDDVLMVPLGNWLLVDDPYNTNPNAPYRHVPAVGHALGVWCESIANRGVHFIPSTQQDVILGARGVSGYYAPDDQDRTDIADAGVNMIQPLTGIGILIRNFFTPSTAVEFKFANGLLMRNFIKVSAVSSLAGSENTPNSLNRVREDASAIKTFLYRLWNVGSTGYVTTGETFGQTLQSDGVTPTKPEQHFDVQADLVNNPVVSLQAGQRNLDVWFTFPAPAGSIRIGVGILLLS